MLQDFSVLILAYQNGNQSKLKIYRMMINFQFFFAIFVDKLIVVHAPFFA